MSPHRFLWLTLAAAALLAADGFAVWRPSEHLGWETAKAAPLALLVGQLTLAAAALVWAPGPFAARLIAASAVVGFGCVLAERVLLVHWAIPLTLWLMLLGMTAGLCALLRIAGLAFVDERDAAPGGGEASRAGSAELGPRQFSIASLLTLTLGVALLAGVGRYVLPVSGYELVRFGLLCSGWSIMSIAAFLLVALDGPFWHRAILAVLLIGYVVLIDRLTDGSTPPGIPQGNPFTQVCVLTAPLVGGFAGLLRMAGYDLRWEPA